MVPSQSTVLLDATSTLLVPIASSPLETVKFPLMSNSDWTVLSPVEVKLKKLFPEWVFIVLLLPESVTVPEEGVKPPLVPLSSQLPATLWLPDPGVNVPDVIVKFPSRSNVKLEADILNVALLSIVKLPSTSKLADAVLVEFWSIIKLL